MALFRQVGCAVLCGTPRGLRETFARAHLFGDLLDVALKAVDVLIDHAQSLLESLLKAAAHGHDLAHTLHRAANLLATEYTNKFSE